MLSQKYKNSLVLSYKLLDSDGKTKSKSNTINNLNPEITNEKAYEVAILIKNLMAYSSEKITRKNEEILLED
ncbi:MAG: DUF1659 domain-containing protein [Oscillospiraceae bacterium]|nr:DUF1659 domain-containing protein [Oscillospiraceae bacterium]